MLFLISYLIPSLSLEYVGLYPRFSDKETDQKNLNCLFNFTLQVGSHSKAKNQIS